MKLYHIDRTCILQEGQILQLKSNFTSINPETEKYLELTQSYIGEGLSQHGVRYFLNGQTDNNIMLLDNVMEIVFEYERLLNYSDKLSRHKAFYAFDKDGVLDFISKQNLNNSFYKIYEVESDYYEAHNMSLISGNSHLTMAAMAKCYWEGLEDPLKRKTLTEYLLKYPIKVIKEVKLEDIK